MKQKMAVFFIIMSLVVLFILFGIPKLKEIKQNPPSLHRNVSEGEALIGGRILTMDISIENMCVNILTTEKYTKCKNSTNCNQTCAEEGCDYFSLDYVGSDFSEGKCKCICHEENKIKKALTPT